ncbi:BrnT family toxin [uncultured Parasphingorhabdus sp.]|uniref:BrnT family toxin n=1 Tax=uncultured Parasphingorhabdus sp. TaxID=2709694 RepID=UPI0030DD0CFA
MFHICLDIDFEYDPAKDAINREKHHLPLSFGQRIFDDPFYTVTDTIRLGDEEQRFKLIGEVDGKLFTAIHVWRGNIVRFISVRRSNSSEQRDYDSNPR